jgi:hypothetical protein
VFAGVGAEPLEFIGVDSTHYPRREHALEEATNPAYTVPGGGDKHARNGALWTPLKVVTALEPVSNSVRIRPVSGSATSVRN